MNPAYSVSLDRDFVDVALMMQRQVPADKRVDFPSGYLKSVDQVDWDNVTWTFVASGGDPRPKAELLKDHETDWNMVAWEFVASSDSYSS